MRSSKDLAVRLRFDRFPRPDFFRKHYLLAGSVAVLAGVALWLGLSAARGDTQYLPGPVTQNHATFGERCETCHEPFRNVRNEACLACHAVREHSPFVVREADCRDCHVEHLGDRGLLEVSNQACIVCHGDLETKRDAPPIARDVASFAAHPEFAPLREGASDTAAIRFNHEIHLTSDKVRAAALAAPGEQCAPYAELDCRSCHRLDEDGMRMRPVTFDQDCRCCHAQEVQGPLGSIEAPHAEPEVVRRELTAKLLVLGVERANEIFSARETSLPGVRDRGPIDESRSLAEYRTRWLRLMETELYAPFRDEPPLLESNKYCFLCHVEERPYVLGVELPVIAPTKIPQRWFTRGEFGHEKHEMLRCEECHAAVRQSAPTSEVNLPGKGLCERCHSADPVTSAGTECVLCHLYHDTSRGLAHPEQPPIPVPVLLGLEAPEPAREARPMPRGAGAPSDANEPPDAEPPAP